MEGLAILDPSGRPRRKFPLSHIARWAARGPTLTLYTRTPVDVEEVTLTLSADEGTVRAVLDTLTCACMQMVELMQGQQQGDGRPAGGGNADVSGSLAELLASGGARRRRAPTLPTAEEVEFWTAPDKAGWLQSQGDVIKTWRRRWHVLKQGHLFRFAGPEGVTRTARPRGVVDLAQVTDVSEARASTGRDCSLRLATAAGAELCYLADSETEQVEWLSALEGGVHRIARTLAGEDGDGGGPRRRVVVSGAAGGAAPAPPPAAPSRPPADWARRLEAGYSAAAGQAPPAGGRPASAASNGWPGAHRGTAPSFFPAGSNPVVSVVGYGDTAAAAAPTAPHDGGGDGGGGGGGPAGYDGGGGGDTGGSGAFGGGPTYQGMAGVAGVASSNGPHPQQQRPAGYAGGGGYPAFDAPPAAAPAPYYSPAPPPPQAPVAAAHPPSLPAPWAVVYTPEGRPYFYNGDTRETRWDPPGSLV